MTQNEMDGVRSETLYYAGNLAAARIVAGDDRRLRVQLIEYLGQPCLVRFTTDIDPRFPSFTLEELVKMEFM